MAYAPMTLILSDYDYNTSNVTGRHRGPKRKLRADCRVPSLQRTGWLPSTVTKMDITCCDCVFIVRCGIARFLWAVICMYSKFQHHPHPLGYLCVVLSFFCSLHYRASPWRKITYSITQSITHSPSIFDAPRTAFALQQVAQLW